ncbi:MAG: tetratricopeptide repeat protein [Steroidobacteraceae bacterium]
MRVLIADDSASLPSTIQEMFQRAPAGKSAGGELAAQIEAVLVTRGVGAPAAAKATSVRAPSDDCGPRPTLPPCGLCDLNDQPELHATVLEAIGIALLNRGCIDAGSKFVLAARDIRLEHFGKNHPYTAASYNSYSRVLRIRDELIEAEKEVGKAIVINRKVYGSGGLPLVANLNELGAVRLYQGDFRGALKVAESGLKILKKRGVYKEDPNTSRLLDVQGRALEGLGKLAPALRALNAALKLDEKQVGSDHPKYATHRANLATVQWAQGNLSDARAGFELAVAVYEKVLSRPGHPNLIDVYANLGSVLIKLGDLPLAKDYLCKALGLNEQLRGAGHTLVGNDHANLGRYYLANGNKPAALEQFIKALGIYKENVKRKRLPRKHPYIMEAEVWIERSKC